MVYSKNNRIFWGILFLICFVGIILTSKDMFFIYFFTIASGFVFSIDYYNIKKHYDPNRKNIVALTRWHIYANAAQWIFWIAVLYILFISERSIGYKAFIIVDLFIVATFASLKYKKQRDC
ncbi:hypothetical protein [Clostridium sp.]